MQHLPGKACKVTWNIQKDSQPGIRLNCIQINGIFPSVSLPSFLVGSFDMVNQTLKPAT